eukprot:10896247-Lingulodinium_polyedra.AAC.1
MRVLRCILGMSNAGKAHDECHTDVQVWQKAGQPSTPDLVACRRLLYLGRLLQHGPAPLRAL